MSEINKKTSRIFKSVVVSAILLAFMLSALAGCNSETENSSAAEVSQQSQTPSSSEVSETVSGEESSETISEDSSEAESVDESNPQTESSSDEETSEESEDESLPVDESSEVSDESIEPEILGTVLTIESEDVSLEYEGVPYIAKKGKVTVEIEYALASDAILFEIFNEGDSDATFLLQFENPEGTMANPKKVTDISKDNKVSIPAGAETGYHYSYVAEKDGELRFYKTSSVASVLSVTNNSTSANRTSDETEEEYVELEVKAGDEIIIVVGAQRDKRNNLPAVDITWNAIYA